MTEKMTLEQVLARDGHLAYMNKGISMMPLLRQGRDVMLIDRKGAEPCKKLDAVLFRRPVDGDRRCYVMHRILRVNGDGTYWIAGDNCISGETVKEEQILGILTGIVRDGRTIPVTDRRYRLYVNTWCRFYHLRFFVLRARWFCGRCARRLGLRRKKDSDSGRRNDG